VCETVENRNLDGDIRHTRVLLYATEQSLRGGVVCGITIGKELTRWQNERTVPEFLAESMVMLRGELNESAERRLSRQSHNRASLALRRFPSSRPPYELHSMAKVRLEQRKSEAERVLSVTSAVLAATTRKDDRLFAADYCVLTTGMHA
jgi:hypothetical protein